MGVKLCLTLVEEHRGYLGENMELREIKETGGGRKLHNMELHNLYFSPSIITRRLIKLRRMRWADGQSKNGGEEEFI
jgi:hypothetical protein